MEGIKNTLKPYKGLSKEIYIIFLSRIVNSIGTFVFPLLALILTQRIGFTKVEAGNFVTIFAVAQVPTMLLGGKLVDSYGRKKIIIVFQSLGALTYIVCGFIRPSTTMALLIIVASCFYSITFPAFDAVVADITTPENRKSSYSLIYMGHNLGFAIGPILAGLLFKNHLSLIFIGDALTTILSLILFVSFIGETRKSKSEMELENGDCSEMEKHQEGSVLSILFKRPILIYFALIMFIYQFAYSQWNFTLPLQMGDLFGKNGGSLFGFLAGFNGLVVLLFTPLVTAKVRKLAAMKTIALGGVLYAVAFGIFGFTSNLYLFFVAIFIMTIGEIMIAINNGTFIADHTPASHRGRINSVLPIIIGSGYALGPMIMGNVMYLFGHTVTWVITALVVFLGAVFMRILEIKQTNSKGEDLIGSSLD